MIRVHISSRQETLRAPHAMIRKTVRLAGAGAWSHGTVSVVLVGHDEMCALNHRHTGRKGDTDVLAFPLQDSLPGDDTIGEVVVCASRAQKEALARSVEPIEELLLYIVHGVAHLAGFDDHTSAERRRMYAREEEILRQAGIRNVREYTAQRHAANG